MQRIFFKSTVALVSVAALVFSACKKDIVEPVSTPAPLNAVMTNSNLLMSTTAPTSQLSGSSLMLGINGHLGDAPYLATSPAKQMQILKDRGLAWYRLNVQTMSDGTASASTLLEALITAATNAGIKILPMLYLRTLSYSDSESASYKKGKTLGANFAAKYAKYFTYYNLGNDLELDLLYPNTTGRSQFNYDRGKFNVVAAYLKGVDEGIKSQDPDAKTMISAGWLHYGFLRMCDWYGVKFDVVGYNWYSDMEGAAANSPNNVPDITVKLASLFPNKPIWFTEFNYRYKTSRTESENESEQNTFVTKFIAKCRANPQVKVAMLYQLFDEPYKSWQESKYGVIKWNTEYTSWVNKALSNTLLAN